MHTRLPDPLHQNLRLFWVGTIAFIKLYYHQPNSHLWGMWECEETVTLKGPNEAIASGQAWGRKKKHNKQKEPLEQRTRTRSKTWSLELCGQRSGVDILVPSIKERSQAEPAEEAGRGVSKQENRKTLLCGCVMKWARQVKVTGPQRRKSESPSGTLGRRSKERGAAEEIWRDCLFSHQYTSGWRIAQRGKAQVTHRSSWQLGVSAAADSGSLWLWAGRASQQKRRVADTLGEGEENGGGTKRGGATIKMAVTSPVQIDGENKNLV